MINRPKRVSFKADTWLLQPIVEVAFTIIYIFKQAKFEVFLKGTLLIIWGRVGAIRRRWPVLNRDGANIGVS